MKAFALVILALIGAAGATGAEEQWLFQVFGNAQEDRATLVSSGLTPYALLAHSIIAEGTPLQAKITGLPYASLLAAPASGAFYLVFPPFGKAPHEVRGRLQGCEVLAEDEDAFFVRADPKEAESLLPEQFHIARIGMTPIDIGLSFPVAEPRVTTYNPVIQWIIDQITVGDISGMLRELTGERPVMIRGSSDTIRTRDSRTAKNSSAIWYFFEKASSFSGLDSVAFHPFSWFGGVDSNVVVTKIGRVYPRRQYLIGGHIDATSEQTMTLAPGADDNGTGTIATLIAIKVISRLPFKRTIKFIAFNCEEMGVIGSERYASEAKIRGDSILGMFNGDIIGTNYTGNDSVVAFNYGRPGSIFLTNLFYTMDTTYHLGLNIRQDQGSGWGADQYRFWEKGYEAAGIFENDFSIYMHTSYDRITTLDTIYWTKVVKCMVATLCDLAEPDTFFIGVEEPSTHQLSYASQFPLTVHPNPFASFSSIPGHESERFALYDVSGRRVGVYKGDRIGEGLRAGVYFLRAESGEGKPVRIVKVR
jgi:hypothetical protein